MAEQDSKLIPADYSSINDAQAKLSQASAIVDLIYCLHTRSDEGMESLNDETLSWALTTTAEFLRDAHADLMPKGGAA